MSTRIKGFKKNNPIGEKDIIYYADKRVNHDEVVSLEKRLEYLIERYAKNQKTLHESIRQNFELCRKVENKLFSMLSFGPEDLYDMIR